MDYDTIKENDQFAFERRLYMVQYKKDEIKESIDNAALVLFAKEGYRGTKISDISKVSNVSIGNIYRYYKNKKELFYTIVPENFFISIESILKKKIEVTNIVKLNNEKKSLRMKLLNDDIIEFMVKNRERMLIVFKNNKGTKYKNAKEHLVEFLINTVHENSNKEKESSNNQEIVVAMKIIYINLINMILDILEETKDISKVKDYLSHINSYHMFGITGLLE